jgi:hypothetical protein
MNYFRKNRLGLYYRMTTFFRVFAKRLWGRKKFLNACSRHPIHRHNYSIAKCYNLIIQKNSKPTPPTEQVYKNSFLYSVLNFYYIIYFDVWGSIQSKWTANESYYIFASCLSSIFEFIIPVYLHTCDIYNAKYKDFMLSCIDSKSSIITN